MASNQAARYVARAALAARGMQEAEAAEVAEETPATKAKTGSDLSPAALAYITKTFDAIPAAVFREFLEKEYLHAVKRSWRWTAKAEALRKKRKKL